jgi:hypothetical protein
VRVQWCALHAWGSVIRLLHSSSPKYTSNDVHILLRVLYLQAVGVQPAERGMARRSRCMVMRGSVVRQGAAGFPCMSVV